MVLPVNWRSTLSFEEGGPMKPGDKAQSGDSDRFELKDITADTIPAVRNLISDVMCTLKHPRLHCLDDLELRI